jgi:MFS family permease
MTRREDAGMPRRSSLSDIWRPVTLSGRPSRTLDVMTLATPRRSPFHLPPRRFAIALAVPSLLLAMVGIPMQIAVAGTDPATIAFIVVFAAVAIELAVLGGYVAYRVPENAVGWLLAVAGLGAAISFYGGTYAQLVEQSGGQAGPLAVLGGWFGSWLFGPTLGGLAIFLLLLFPTGHLVSPRWRIVVVIALIGLPLSVLGMALAPGPLSAAPSIENPFGVDSDLVGLATTIGNLMAAPVAIAAFASFLMRFRRAHDVERQQLKWFGFTAAVTLAFLITSVLPIGPLSDAAWVATILTLVALPAGIAMAILRYRLWEIDRIVSRTIAYTVITVVLGSLFAILVIGLQAVVPYGAENNGLVVAGTTLFLAALFQPLRRAVQRRVDRRFNRARVDADLAAEAFAAHVRDDVDIASVVGEAERLIRDSLAPSSVRTWIAGGGRRA